MRQIVAGFNYRFDSRKRPAAYDRGVEDGRDGYPLQYGMNDQYREGWYYGYRDQLTREIRAYNATHGTNYEPRGSY